MALRGDEFVLQADLGAGFISVFTARSNGFAQAGEAVDVTTKESQGDRTLLVGGGTRARTITLEGVFEDDPFFTEFQSRWEAGTLDPYQIVHLTDGLQYAGSFQVTSLDLAGDYNDGMTYSMTLESSGVVVQSDTIT